MPFSIIAAAVSNDIESGRTTRRSDGMTRTSEYAPGAPPEYATRSPTLTWVTPAPIASTTPAPSLPIPEGRAILYRPERWYTSRKFSPQALWRTRASPGPGSPTWTSSHFMTSGPPCWWMRIALGIASPWVDGLIGGARGASLLGRSFAAGRLLTSTLHRREARFLHFQALDGHAQDVEVHIQPVLHRLQLGDTLVHLARRRGRRAQPRHRQAHGAPETLQEFQRIRRLAHALTRSRNPKSIAGAAGTPAAPRGGPWRPGTPARSTPCNSPSRRGRSSPGWSRCGSLRRCPAAGTATSTAARGRGAPPCARWAGWARSRAP